VPARQNRADYRLSLEGKDLGPGSANTFAEALRKQFLEKISPRLVSLTLSEKRGGEADCLELVLSDHDGKLDIPQPGAVLALQLGWHDGPDVTPGLVDKGRFKVDEACWEGPPDVVTIRARSADFAASFDRRREKPHVGRTLGAIVREIATGQGLTAGVDSSLASIEVPVLDQDEMSDGALLRMLGRHYDAAATVKNGTLLFAPIGAARAVSGTAIPAGAITRRSGDHYSYRRGERGQFGGVEARWHDKDEAARKTVTIGGSGASGKPAKRLKRIYASEGAAKRAAEGAAKKMDRAQAEFEIELALGRPDLFPERPMGVSGFKPEIDARSWLVAEAEHTLTSDGGLMTKLKLEAGG